MECGQATRTHPTEIDLLNEGGRSAAAPPEAAMEAAARHSFRPPLSTPSAVEVWVRDISYNVINAYRSRAGLALSSKDSIFTASHLRRLSFVRVREHSKLAQRVNFCVILFVDCFKS